MHREILLAGTFAVACAAALPGQSALSPEQYVAAMAREHAHDAPVAGAPARAPRQEVRTREVVYDTVHGEPVSGFMAWPARGGRFPGVVMIHEWWGLNDNIKQAARRLAGEGYRVLAVDLYGGRVADTPQDAATYMREVTGNTGLAVANLRSAARFLKERQRAPAVGVVGWCFGGAWALQSALIMPEYVDAAVMYYGRPVTDRDRLASIDAPLLALFGAEDRSIPVEQVREMESALRELGKPVEVHVYEGAAHAFANPSGQAYQAQAAEDAWNRTVAFFAEHLRASQR